MHSAEVAHIYRRPQAFLEQELGISLWSKQAEILTAVRDNRRVAVRSCNGAGKTFTAACATIWWLMAFRESAVVITTAPSERQVKELLWREIRAIHARNADKIGGTLTTTGLDITPARYARGFSTDSPGRFQGFHDPNILFVVDEASEVREDIYEAIEGSMTSAGARLLLIGNPTHLSGTFFNAFHSRRSLWHTIHISAFDTPNFHHSSQPSHSRVPSGRGIEGEGETVELDRTLEGRQAAITQQIIPGLTSPTAIAESEELWGRDTPAYQVRVLGEFPSQAENSLFSLSDIDRATVLAPLSASLVDEEIPVATINDYTPSDRSRRPTERPR